MFGVNCLLHAIESDVVHDITIESGQSTLTISSPFFALSDDVWLTSASLPGLPLAHWDLSQNFPEGNFVGSSIPVIYGHSGFNQRGAREAHLDLDVFGSVFFMLSRYEEAIGLDRDCHDRFPAMASIAYKAGFLGRPIADEYVEILWECMKRLWPELERKPRQSRTLVSCDVDNPYESYIKSWPSTARKFAGDLVKRRSLREAVLTLQNFRRSRAEDYSKDPLNTFEWIMDVNEYQGNRVAFYFLVDHSVAELDGHYCINEPRIRTLMRRIHERGHEIGLHSSYGTYKNGRQLKKEAETLRQVLEEECIDQHSIGARQHYLRWSSPETAGHMDAAGISYDTTLGYADYAGFRCGTCHEYPMYDVIQRRQLNLRQRPLVVMERSVIDQTYMGLGTGPAGETCMSDLRDSCRRVWGDFTLLWHNSYLQKPENCRLYQKMIS